MPYPEGHRTEVRKKIVQSARRLFNRHGFNGVSLQQIMAGAGLTHGGFYSYFGQQKRSLCRGPGLLLHRSRMEELLGRCRRRPVLQRGRPASCARLSVAPTF
jgi:AcrR family transcriptional regulator